MLTRVRSGYLNIEYMKQLSVFKGFMAEILAYLLIINDLNGYYNILWQPYLRIEYPKRSVIIDKSEKYDSLDDMQKNFITIKIKSRIKMPSLPPSNCIKEVHSFFCPYAHLVSLPQTMLDKAKENIYNLKKNEFKSLLMKNIQNISSDDILRGIKNIDLTFDEQIFSSLFNIDDKLKPSERRKTIREMWIRMIESNKDILEQEDVKLLLLINPLNAAYIIKRNMLDKVANKIKRHLNLLDFLVTTKYRCDILVISRDEWGFISKVLLYEVKSSESGLKKINVPAIKELIGGNNNIEFYTLVVYPYLVNNKIKFEQYRIR